MVLMVDSTDHVTGKTGLTLTITASKAGAAFASISPTVTERGSGWYSLALTTAHLDTLGDFALHVTGTAADPADLLLEVVAYNPEDAAALGLSRIDAAVSTRSTLTQAQIVSDSTPFLGASVAAIKSKTDNLPASPAAVGSLMGLADDAITAAKIAAGAITSSEAPALANLDAAVSTRLATAGYTAPANADVTAIKAKTDNLPAAPAAVSNIPSAAANASAVRSELATELGRVDASVSSRLAGASYTAPDNAGIAAAELAAESVDARLPADPADESALEAAIATRSAPGDAMTLSSAAVDAVLDEAIEGSVTLRQAMRVLLAVLAGKVSGAPAGPIVYRDVNDTADRVTGTIDAEGNRSAVTLNV
jgi:hypothetical protein